MEVGSAGASSLVHKALSLLSSWSVSTMPTLNMNIIITIIINMVIINYHHHLKPEHTAGEVVESHRWVPACCRLIGIFILYIYVDTPPDRLRGEDALAGARHAVQGEEAARHQLRQSVLDGLQLRVDTVDIQRVDMRRYSRYLAGRYA